MRKALIAAGALTLALTVSACGDKEGGTPTGADNQQNTSQSGVFNDAQSLINAAKEGTAKAKTSKFSIEMDMGAMLNLKAEGEAEYAGEDSKVAMTSTMDLKLPGMSGSGEPLKMETIMVGKTMYMRFAGGMPGGGPDTDKWMKMSIDQAGAGQFGQGSEFSDPANTLEMIKENGKITSTEQTQVDGQPVTKYSVELDFGELAKKMGMGQQLPDGVTIDSVPMDVYLNSDNLPVQIEVNLGPVLADVAKQAKEELPEGMESARMIAKYSNWGEPVNIQVPSPDQVTEMELPGLGGTGSTPGMPGGTGSTPPSVPGMPSTPN
ncbi:hypothetical protein [Thermocrispum sp.]|uniref:LppX_LprAFG lipoprotein n=1 Tax=Thermocrispum agreste TaxID=37925 RepID=A0ABD6FDD2_9PSEU|nr:hypothetical protein [Thermocrispum sp.]